VPGALLLAEAGGTVGRPDGRPYTPRDAAPPGLVAAADRTAYERVCRALASSDPLA
jgi:fructose-1,6-bisphosphatase/inositol monophosphatase family enzyme